jgi:predicted nucleotidyltransferase
MFLDEPSLRTIRSILRRHVTSTIEVLAFGSRAHGRNLKPFSDLDLCLRDRAAVPSAVLEVLDADFRNSDLPIKVDVIDWHRVAPAFRDAIAGDLVPFPLDPDGAPALPPTRGP